MAEARAPRGRRRKPGAWALRRLAQELVAAAGGQERLPAHFPDHWSERARSLTVARSALILIRQRPRATALAARLVPGKAPLGSKLQLWGGLGRAWRLRRLPPRGSFSSLLISLAATQAWNDARLRLQIDRLRPMPRLHDGLVLARILSQQQPRRLIFWHHHDPLGELPNSWLNLLAELRRRDWLVVVSSSGLGEQALHNLQRHGLLACRRDNIGLCLGAYKDLCLLLADLALQPQALLLCNDSTLPLGSNALVENLENFARQAAEASRPRLAGFTDSVERGAYHLQSYWLEANGPLLASPAWRQFWQGLPITGDKDTLIDAGEVGLSQALLWAGVELRARYPLLAGLLHDPAMALELQRAGIRGPLQLNQSLQAWRSLLARGFPLVKKRVLFDGDDNSTGPPALTQLLDVLAATLGPTELIELEHDLQHQLRSRHSRPMEQGP